MELSIIIVNFNTKELTQKCIDSIICTTTCKDYEIIVVDNSENEKNEFVRLESQKGTVRVINKVENKGFGNACNIGVDYAKGEYIMLINSDIIVSEGAVDNCLMYIRNHSQVGVLGAKVVLKDGTLDHGCKRGFPTVFASFCYFCRLDRLFPKSKKIGAYRQTFADDNSTNEVDAVSGSFMLIKKSVYDEVNGFDEDFFMYGEDLDLCYRVKEKGRKNIYLSQACVTHLKGQSGLAYKSDKTLFHFYNAMKIFYRKHYEQRYNSLINNIMYKAIDLKYMLDKRRKR